MRRRTSVTLTWMGLGAACAPSSPSPAIPQTVDVDCVAVLGSPPPSAEMTLAGVPYSGLPRDELIANLSDAQLARLCDFDACLRFNGYGRKCYDVGASQFQLGTIPELSAAVQSCLPVPLGAEQDSWDSREDCVTIYSTYFGSCRVANAEDCLREESSDPFAATGWAPDCEITRAQCPVY